MKINRSIEKELLAWKNSKNRKPLILRGARQVGKTFIIEAFGKRFKYFIRLNLERASERKLFEGVNTGNELFERILLHKGIHVDERETLLFIDEIQNSSEAIGSLRFLYEDLDHLRVIAAGSLLEVFSRREGFSFPVGRVQSRFMFPVHFGEYLEFRNPPLAEKLASLEVGGRVEAHEIFLNHFYQYAFVGGMPEALAGYLESGSYSQLRDVYDSIYTGYLEDVEKYSGLAKSKYLTHTIDHAPLYSANGSLMKNSGTRHLNPVK